MRSFLAIAALCGITNSVYATTATPCDKYTGMVDADGDKWCAFVGAATAATTGWSGKTDCRDDIAGINPGVKEIVADGIDQDCSGADAVFPVADSVAKRYLANSGTAGPMAFITEYDRCKAATGRCSLDDVAGKFVVTDPEKDLFVDIYTGTTKVLGADGVREVVSREEASHFRGGSAAGGGIGVKKVTEIAKKEAEAAVTVEHNERLMWQTNIESGNTSRDGVINNLAKALEEEELARRAAVEAEHARAKAAEMLLVDRLELVESDTLSVLSHGPLFEVGSVFGVNFRRGLNVYDEDGEFTGEEIREPALAGGGFELRAGVDARSYELAGFGQLSFGSDTQGSSPDIVALIGADILVEVSDGALVGPWVGYVHSEDHASYLDVSVLENGVLGGMVVSGSVPMGGGAARFVPFVRLGAGTGWYGARGGEDGEDAVSWYGPIGVAQAGIRFGAGALQ